jgi:hypothetical protein
MFCNHTQQMKESYSINSIILNLNKSLTSKHSSFFVIRRSRLQMSARKPVILTKVFNRFPGLIKANAYI